VSVAPIWANLLHLSYNMWSDRSEPAREANQTVYKPFLRCESDLWDEIIRAMAAAGMNMVVIDVGDAVRFDSHPEIAVKGAWTPARLRRELDKIRKLGIEPVPKLNFSTCHDAWLGPYSRCVSTDAYYGVCEDLIAETAALFEKPRFFHLGMDEETERHQRSLDYIVIRQFDLWWKDLYFLQGQVERAGCRAWVWSDYVWNHPDLFWKKMPKSILQSNWYYGTSFSKKLNYVKAYLDLEAHGYDQVPTGSNWSSPVNFERTVRYAVKHIDPSRLKGFMQCSWRPTMKDYRPHQLEAVDQVARTILRDWR
jgi:hypothetical protein